MDGNNTKMEIVEQELCYGCNACYNICPVNAIVMKQNTEGFFLPEIDDTKCIHCNKCKDVCPAIDQVYNKSSEPEIFAFQAEGDILNEGSSGGVFPLLAKEFLENNGIVFGVAFDDNWSAKHIAVDDIEDLEKITLSKYLQSDTGDSFKKVKELLGEGKQVLYAGCPCQIAGLNLFLGKEYDNLITVDLLCHGVPSPGCFSSYLKENFQFDRIEKIAFRGGEKWSPFFKVNYNDGKLEEYSLKNNAYVRAFLKDVNLRRTCYGCKYNRLPRQGDITIGDLWGARKMDLGFPNPKTSVVLLNSKKGETAFFSAVTHSKEKHHLKKLSLKTKRLNGNIFRSTVSLEKLKERSVFFETYSREGFNKAVYKTTSDFKTGLILYLSSNYGSMASNLSLYKYLERMGKKPLVCDNLVRPKGEFGPLFVKQYMNRASDYFRAHDYKELNKVLDTFVVGSDMTWNNNLAYMKKYPEYMLLGFADDSKLKLAYVPSFGGSAGKDIDDDRKAICSYFMKRFDKIAVREEEGKNACKRLYDCDVEVMMDPFFLSDAAFFKEIADYESDHQNEQYLLAYILNPSEKKNDLIKEIAKEKNLKIYFVPDREKKLEDNIELINDLKENVICPDFGEWVHLFINADYVITDSYHGSCLSLVLNKDFIGIRNRSRYRFDRLSEVFSINDRIINEEDCDSRKILMKNNIDYIAINRKLDSIRQEIEKWWQEAFLIKKNDKNSESSDVYDISMRYVRLLRSMV